DDFYAVDDPFNGQGDFEPLFRLDDIALLVNVDGTVKGKGKSIEVDVGDKGKNFATADDVKKDIHKLSIETRRELFLKKNDKVRVRAECRGTILVFEDTPQHVPSDGGPSQASGSSQKTKWTKAKVSESKGIQCSP
ncbi:zinc finger, SWIM-type containing protein, partial [Tanacetum coccineum]